MSFEVFEVLFDIIWMRVGDAGAGVGQGVWVRVRNSGGLSGLMKYRIYLSDNFYLLK